MASPSTVDQTAKIMVKLAVLVQRTPSTLSTRPTKWASLLTRTMPVSKETRTLSCLARPRE